MTKRSSVAALWIALAVIVLFGFVGWAVFGAEALEVSILALLLVLAGALFELHRKTRSAIRQLGNELQDLRAERDTIMRELAGIVFLNTCLQPRQPLPSFSGYSIRPDFAERLAGEVLSRQSPTVVELGSGLSTVIIALCLEKTGGGRIVSFDHEEDYAASTRRMLQERSLEGRATVALAALAPWGGDGEGRQWYAIDDALLPPSIDVLVVDGPPGPLQPLARYPALPALYARLAPGAMIYLDDGGREDEQQIASRWQQEYPGLERVDFPSRSGVIGLRKTGP